MGIEIERKFTVNRLPDDLDTFDFHMIEQAYLTSDPVIRVRREDDDYYMTYKGTGKNDTSLAHAEYNLPLSKEAYNTLLSKADGNIICKKRILIPYGKHTIELDILEGVHKGLIIAEVEFTSIKEAEGFTPPQWFDKDVTDLKEYRNSYLSLKAQDR